MRMLIMVIVLSSSTMTFAEEATIVLWNAKELFTVADVQNRATELQNFAATMKPDILLIDEVCSIDVVEEVRDVMGLTNYFVACSDFVQNDGNQHGSFEVGILSKYPITHVVEYDQTPDNKPSGRDGEPIEAKLDADSLLKTGLKTANSSRGFLWACIDKLKLTICVSHLKSSSGGNEQENAMKREYVTAAMALSVLDDKLKFPGWSYAIAADINVGATDIKKNGTNLFEDAVGNQQGDRYDDTHAILGAGLVHGLKMTNLTKNVRETYDSPNFPGTGPIDNIYADGQLSRFTTGQKSTNTFGSDHFAVWTTYQIP